MDYFCLFGVFRPTRVFFTDLESSPLPVKGCTFWPMLGTCELWGFFSVSHLLWHGTLVYNVHLRGPMTLTPNAERLAVERSLPVLKTKVCRGWVSYCSHFNSYVDRISTSLPNPILPIPKLPIPFWRIPVCRIWLKSGILIVLD